MFSKTISITTEQADKLAGIAESIKLKQLLEFWRKFGVGSFNEFPALAQTVLYDLFYNGNITKNSKFMQDFITAALSISPANPLGTITAWSPLADDLFFAGGPNATRWVEDGSLINQLLIQIVGQGTNLTVPTMIEGAAKNGTNTSYSITNTDLGSLFGLDPAGAGMFTLTEDSSSPNFATIMMPSSWSGSFLVSYETGSVWSSPQQDQPLQTINLPSGVDGLRVTLLNSEGDPVTNQDDFTFYVTFASTGNFSGTVTTPPSITFDPSASFSNSTAVTLTGETDDSAAITSVDLYNGATDIGAATVNPDGTWSFSHDLAAGSYRNLQVMMTDANGVTVTASAPFSLTTGITGQPYSAKKNDYNTDDQLVGQTFFNSDGSVYLADTVSYSPDDEIVSYGYYTGAALSDEAYPSYEYDYTAGAFTSSEFFYPGVAGAPYASYEYDYDGAGRQTRAVFSDVTGAPYSSYKYDYVGGVFAGSKYTFTTAPSGATYSSYEVDYDQANAFAGVKFFFDDDTGQGYTGEEADFDADEQLSRILLTGVDDQPYSSIELDYSAGIYRAIGPTTRSPANRSPTKRWMFRLRGCCKRSSIPDSQERPIRPSSRTIRAARSTKRSTDIRT